MSTLLGRQRWEGTGTGIGFMRSEDGMSHLISKVYIRSVFFLTGRLSLK